MANEEEDGPTRQTVLPETGPDEVPTGNVADVGIVAELRAVLTNGEKKTLPLYKLADQLVVGRGTACEWQLDDPSLSRKHAQLKWNGRELTVEDLGSANGTRVGGRPARTATPAHAGEVIQLGTVVLTLESRTEGNPDDQSTNLVATPESRAEAFPNLPGLATVVKPTQPRAQSVAPPFSSPAQPYQQGQKVGGPQLFHPSKNAARPDEPTRPWDPRAALAHPKDKAFDGEMMARLKESWRENRRPFVLAGAALWIGILLTVWYIHDSMIPEEDNAPLAARPSAPKVTNLNPPPPDPLLGLVPDGGSETTSEERESALADAIAAYDQGRLADALGLFRQLAAGDETARFMVDLIQQRLAQGAP